jgi:hypothetical protein
MALERSLFNHNAVQSRARRSSNGIAVVAYNAAFYGTQHPYLDPVKVGDIVPYCRTYRAVEPCINRRVGSRIVGFEVDEKDPERCSVNTWVVCDGLPVLVATDKLRPCTAAELVAYPYMHGNAEQPIAETYAQQ